MSYTNQEIRNEVCEIRGYDAETHGTKREFIKEVLADVEVRRLRRVEEAQAQLDAIPTSAKKILVRQATRSLIQKANAITNAQALSDSDNIDL